LLLGKNLSNVQNENFGLKKIKDEIIWYEDENFSFDTNEEENIYNDNE